MTDAEPVFKGECFCGKVKIEATGAPEGQGFCHCASCRSWSAGPVNAFTLWKPERVRVVEGAELVGSFSKTKMSVRHWCTACGGHVFSEHPPLGLTDVYAATIPAFPFAPKLHVNYSEAVLPIKDGLVKFADFPAAFGGSDKQLAE